MLISECRNRNAVIDKQPWLDKLDGFLKKRESDMKEQFSTFKKGLIRCCDYIFNFLENPLISADNNASERGIRKLKIK